MKRHLSRLKLSLHKRLIRLNSNIERKRLAAATRGTINFHRKEALPEKKGSSITVILNLYNRPEYLRTQLEALQEQTIRAEQIWIWCNPGSKALYDFSELCDRVVVSNFNWKFFGRFSLGLLARTRYVAFIDDDLLPGKRWFENCIRTIESGHDGILGGVGLILPRDEGYSGGTWLGWREPHFDQAQEVDLVCQSWFLRKQHLQYMWREEPASWDNGEDIHLSYMALKHGGVKSYVPPHPSGQMELWGNHPTYGQVWGSDPAAHSITHREIHYKTREHIVNIYRKDGWVICNERKTICVTDS